MLTGERQHTVQAPWCESWSACSLGGESGFLAAQLEACGCERWRLDVQCLFGSIIEKIVSHVESLRSKSLQIDVAMPLLEEKGEN